MTSESRSWGEYSFLLAVSWATCLWDPALRLWVAQATWRGHIPVFWPRDPARLSKITSIDCQEYEGRFRWFQPRIFQLRPQTLWSRDNLFHWCLFDFQNQEGYYMAVGLGRIWYIATESWHRYIGSSFSKTISFGFLFVCLFFTFLLLLSFSFPAFIALYLFTSGFLLVESVFISKWFLAFYFKFFLSSVLLLYLLCCTLSSVTFTCLWANLRK